MPSVKVAANAFISVLLGLVPFASPSAAQTTALSPLPVRVRATLAVRPGSLAKQDLVAQTLLVPRAVRPYRVPRALGPRAESITVLLLESTTGWQWMGVTRGSADLDADFARLRGPAAGFAGGHEIYRLAGAGEDSSSRLTRLDPRQIAEGSEAALRIGLGTQPPAEGRRLEVERALLGQRDPDSPIQVLYIAPPEGADLVQMVQEAGVIWDLNLEPLVRPYAAALRTLGPMHGARVDVWQEAEALRTRLVLVAPNAPAAQRALIALRTAKQLAPIVADAAVKSGSMTRADATVLNGVLETMQTSASGDQVEVTADVQVTPPPSRP
jgi:hypothetical protein